MVGLVLWCGEYVGLLVVGGGGFYIVGLVIDK